MENGDNVGWMSADIINFCLPDRGTANQFLWVRLLFQPLSISDEELCKMFQLRESFPSSPKPMPGTTIFYVRSYKISAQDLKKVMSFWSSCGYSYDEVDIWAEAIKWRGRTGVIYIRYIGTSDSFTGYQRHFSDLQSRRSGLIALFNKALERVAPSVLEACRVYEFTDAELLNDSNSPLSSYKHRRLIKDARERTLIALFGLESLLNRESGGFYPSAMPSSEQHTRYLSLRLRAFSVMSCRLSSATPEVRENLQNWIQEIALYATRYPHVTNTSQHGFPDKMKKALLSQATPALVDGKNALIAVIGSGLDTSQESWEDASPFFSGKSRTGHVFVQLLSRLHAWEYGDAYFDGQNILPLLQAGAFPFVDLCPWPVKSELKGDHLSAAVGLLRKYISIVQPLVILTFSHRPSSTARANFAHTRGVSIKVRFLATVGQLNLVHYHSALDDDGTARKALEDSYTVQIACPHPAHSRYLQQTKLLGEVLDMTVWIALLTMQVAIEIERQPVFESRFQRCHAIKEQVDRILHQTGIDRHLDKTKKLLIKQMGSPQQRMRRHDKRKREIQLFPPRKHRKLPSIVAADELRELLIAVGPPGSIERRNQAKTLWDMLIPELHQSFPWSPGGQHWYQWAIKEAREGSPLIPDSSNLNSGASPKASTLDGDLLDPVDPDLDNEESEPCAPHSQDGPTLERESEYRRRFHGTEVATRLDNVMLYWQSPDGKSVNFTLLGPSSVGKKVLSDKRYIFLYNPPLTHKVLT
jgi:hypothetical protein